MRCGRCRSRRRSGTGHRCLDRGIKRGSPIRGGRQKESGLHLQTRMKEKCLEQED